jgi:hypothetical protein
MARKKAKNSSGIGILIIFALAFSAVAAIPKNAWISTGVIAGIGVIIWLPAQRAKRQLNQIPTSPQELTLPQNSQGIGLTSSMHEVSTSNIDVEESPEFYTVQLGSRPSTSFKIPDASSQRSDARWVPAGESVTVSGLSLPGGMFYAGSTLGGREQGKQKG